MTDFINPYPIIVAQSKASNVNVNGDYTFVAPPVQMNEGDTLVGKWMLIDTQQLSSATVVLPEDETLVLEGILYEKNTDIAGKTAVTGTLDVDYGLYQMQLSDPSAQGYYHLMHQSVTIPAGNYEPDRIAQYITDQLSYVEPLNGSANVNTGSSLLINSLTGFGGGVSQVNFTDRVVTGEQYFGDRPDYYESKGEYQGGYGPAFYSDAPGNHDPQDKDHYQHISPASTSGAGTGLVMKIFFYGPNNDDDRDPPAFYGVVEGGEGYAIGDTVTFTSDQFAYWAGYRTGANEYFRCPPGGTITWTITNIKDGNAYYEFTPLGEAPNAPSKSYKYTAQYYIGASEVDLAYNNNGNGSFSWQFLHTPEYDNNVSPAQPAVSIVKDTNNNWHTVDRASGFALTNLSPASLWHDVMGFDIDNITCKVRNPDTGELEEITSNTPNTYPIDADSFERATTKSYLGLNALLNNNSNKGSRVVPATGNITEATTLTTSIQADHYRVNSGSGYYIIEINAGYRQPGLSSTGTIQIGGVVSKKDNYNDIVIGDMESSIPYTRVGLPIVLSEYHVRILDHDTGEVVQGLGPNNTLILQLQRAPPQNS